MEEDIKILEELFYDDESFEPNGYVEIFLHKNEQQAIQSLIAKNKELEENLNYRIRYCNILEKELYGENSVELTKLEDKYFIPKSKVKEKMEELIADREEIGGEISIISVLQELLEEN